ncbi:single-stranded DNA-binding protein [Burkholderia pseudomallei]|uniref:single-stranded DNA-binding protein n=1 Tax=Burkholderia pseudomallei TaxID=28450 RepID=UPI001603665E|nr:single-stranded DNA-binding protein [Burkholderia pseudomallei]
MSIDALVSGRLYSKPEARISSGGKHFVCFKLLAADADGENQFCNVVVFSDVVKQAALSLDAGDSCSISGPLKFSTYQARDDSVKVSVGVVAHAVMSPYTVRRKREAAQQASGPKPQASPPAAARKGGLREAQALYGASTAVADDDVDV